MESTCSKSGQTVEREEILESARIYNTASINSYNAIQTYGCCSPRVWYVDYITLDSS